MAYEKDEYYRMKNILFFVMKNCQVYVDKSI